MAGEDSVRPAELPPGEEEEQAIQVARVRAELAEAQKATAEAEANATAEREQLVAQAHVAIEQAKNVARAEGLAQSRASVGSKAKVSQPDHFTGKGDGTVDCWIAEMELYLTLTGADPFSWAAVARYYVKGPSSEFLTSNSPNIAQGTWEDFKTALRASHLVLDPKSAARNRLCVVEQGGRTLLAYSTEVQQLVARMGETSTKEQAVFHFKRGLHVSIASELLPQEFISLEEVVKAATAVNRNLESKASTQRAPETNNLSRQQASSNQSSKRYRSGERKRDDSHGHWSRQWCPRWQRWPRRIAGRPGP